MVLMTLGFTTPPDGRKTDDMPTRLVDAVPLVRRLVGFELDCVTMDKSARHDPQRNTIPTLK